MASRMQMPTPGKFKVLGENTNLARSWELYLKRFEYYLQAAGIKNDDQKKAILLHLSGEEIQDVFENLTDTGTTYEHATTALTDYFSPQKNIAYERHVFRQAKQEAEETIEN